MARPVSVLDRAERARGVTAVLGPTNTGKTHLAIERMLAHGSGLIGLPLRLLAREVYQRLVEKAGTEAVALVTGEEKIRPPRARYWVATAEAMPQDLAVEFLALDEIQLAADPDRGHVFTDRILNRRGRQETLLIGAGTMRPLIERLLPGAAIVSRPRLSQLVFAGERKITRLPPRAAIVAFSAEEVYAIAELIRRQKGGAAVVMGALSPRTRNAQVEFYQSGEVAHLVATDAIGMGLNLDIEHVAFASAAKFDGSRRRPLTPAEIGQIAGRAGRHLRDGSFGTTGRCPPFEPELAETVETHDFTPVTQLHWRNPDLDLSSIEALQASLAIQPQEAGLVRAPMADDEIALDLLARDAEIRQLARGIAGPGLLWRVAQIPDYRKLAPAAHAELLGQIFRYLARNGRLPDDWFSRQVTELDRTDGDIDTLSARIARVRTWTFVANRPDWLRDPEHWQGVTRQVEDRVSDALHERLTQRFVDRRTSVLMRRLREKTMLDAEISPAGEVSVEGQPVGTLHGFQFVPDASASAESPEGRAVRAAAARSLGAAFEARAERFANAVDSAIVLANDGVIRWLGEPVARLIAGDKLLAPRARLLADDLLAGSARETVEAKLGQWLASHVTKLLGPLQILENPPEELTGIARGIAFQVAEAFGILERAKVGDAVKGLDQTARAALRGLGLRFGAYHLYLPALMKPAPRALACRLWALQQGGEDPAGLSDVMHLAASGRTSIPVDVAVPADLYRVAGFRVSGPRAVRVDILERLADLIRPAIAYRPGVTPGEPPAGTADGDGFVVTVAMTSLVGCAGEDFGAILKSLGYRSENRAGPAITKPILPVAATVPAAPRTEESSETAAQEASSPAASETDTPADPVALDHVPDESAPGETPPDSAAPLAEAPADTGSEPGMIPDAPGLPTFPPEDASESPLAVTVEPLADRPDDPAVDVPDTGIPVPIRVADEAVDATGPTPETPGADAPVNLDATQDMTTSDPATPDAPAESAPADAAPAYITPPDAAPAEPVLIEIWHPQRRHARPPHRQGRPEGRRDNRREGQGSGPRREGAPGETRPAPRRDAAAGVEGAPRPRSEGDIPPRSGDERPAGGKPFDKKPFDKKSGGNRPQGGPGGGKPFDKKPFGDRPRGDDRRGPRRDDRRDDRRDREPQVWTSQSGPAAEDDSPFAKLAALKARMAGDGGKGGGGKGGGSA